VNSLKEFARAMDPIAEDGTGAYFLGSSFGVADLALAPWVLRIHFVLSVYKGFVALPMLAPPAAAAAAASSASSASSSSLPSSTQTTASASASANSCTAVGNAGGGSGGSGGGGDEDEDDEDLVRLALWFQAVMARPSFAATVVDHGRLAESYSGYANGSASSDVSNRFVLSRQGAKTTAAVPVAVPVVLPAITGSK